MNELNIYDLFQQILSKSKVIEGRFHISSTETGNDINTENLNDINLEAFGDNENKSKYPLCLLLPPVEEVNSFDELSFTKYYLVMYFLTQSQNDSIGIKNPNFFNNTSNHPLKYDWKDMRECAINFRKAFIKVTEKENYIRDSQTTDVITRVSKVGNDNLNGVKLTFKINVFEKCGFTDYNEEDLNKIKINKTDLHLQHK
ncbi:hypothetical protein ETU09_05805 [Apibacter muscae]|uniref:DUF4255 domain-containing protein n=1 Tax=Apibacter muscae TaxID=2509004 RepID=A0A563DDN5_9FLAO|nr:hypothetical protein [Apibacter muscae]TWP28438.1 hypothetical protein ETU09_05805 [Apibacter muscae]